MGVLDRAICIGIIAVSIQRYHIVTYNQSLSDAVVSAFCNATAASDDYYGLLRNIVTGGSTPGGGPVKTPYDGIRGIGQAIQRGICNREPPTLPEPPFDGGQCPIRYDISADKVQFSSSAGCTPSDSITIPSGFVAIDYWGPIENPQLYGETSGWCDDATTTYQGMSFSCHGFGTNPRLENPITIEVSGGSSPFVTAFQNFTVTPKFEPDDCGNPEYNFPSPQPPVSIDLPDFTYVDNSGNEVNVGPITIGFGYADVDVNADVSIPVTVDVGGVNISGSVNAKGEVNVGINLPGSNPSEGCCNGDPYPDEEPEEPAEDDPTFPVPPPNTQRVIMGANVVVTAISPGTYGSIFQTENPDIYIPNLGFISFFVKINQTRGAWTSDIPVKSLNAAIECPWPLGAIDVRGTPAPGVSWQINPVYNVRSQPRVFPTLQA